MPTVECCSHRYPAVERHALFADVSSIVTIAFVINVIAGFVRRARALRCRTIDEVRSARTSVLTWGGALAFATALTMAPAAAAGPAASIPTAQPASQVDQDRLAAYDEALEALTEELSYVVLLGWGRAPLPAAARDLPAAIGIQRADLSIMIGELKFLDERRGPAALERLRAAGEPVAAVVDEVLSRNLPVMVVGEIPQIGAAPYLAAYDSLIVPWSKLMGLEPQPFAGTTGADPNEPASGPTVPISAPIAASPNSLDTIASATTVRSPDDSTSHTSGPWPVFAVASIVSLAAVIVGLLARRRSTGAGPRLDGDVLDAGRSIMAAVDLDGFLAAVAEQVSRLVGADGAVVVDSNRWVPTRRELPAGTVLERAMTTGRSVRTDDATVVPIVAQGHVVGVLVSWSVLPQTEETLGAFAPLVGAALQGVRTRIEHEHLAFDDALTGVGNRRRFDRDLERFVGLDSGRGLPVALAMVDVDHFKRFNDTHGHQIGDVVLQHVAQLICANVRTGDLVYRYGGEEFAVLLPGAELDDAVPIVERVRAAIAMTPLPGDGLASVAPVTVSVGVSVTPPADGTAMVRAADGALYAAKSGGRNRVETVAPA